MGYPDKKAGLVWPYHSHVYFSTASSWVWLLLAGFWVTDSFTGSLLLAVHSVGEHCRPSSPYSVVFFLPLPNLRDCLDASESASTDTIFSLHLIDSPSTSWRRGRFTACFMSQMKVAFFLAQQKPYSMADSLTWRRTRVLALRVPVEAMPKFLAHLLTSTALERF